MDNTLGYELRNCGSIPCVGTKKIKDTTMYDYIFFTDVTDTVLTQKAIGAYKVANILRQQGRRCLVIDHLHSWSIEEFKQLVDLCVDENTKAIGISTSFLMNSNTQPQDDGSVRYSQFSANTSVFPQGKEFENTALEYVKSKNPAIKVIAGGVNVHNNISNKNINFVVIGYAETAILDIDRHLEHSDPIPNAIKNVWGITVIKNQVADNYDFKNSRFQWENTDTVNARVLPIEIARGCIFKCKFCSYPLNGKNNLDFVRSAELLREELQRNYDQFGIKYYSILDDTFNDNEHKLNLMLEAVNKLSFQPIFWAYTRLDLLTTKQHVNKLYDIGLRSFYFGIESMNPETGRIVGKGFDRNRQIETIQDIRSRYPDVAMHGSFIIGLPKESKESVIDTFEKCLSQDIPLHSWLFKGLRLYKPSMAAWSSELDLNYQKYGYEQLPTPEDSAMINWRNSYMDCFEANDLAKEFHDRSQNSDHMMASGTTVWPLKNYGYSQEYLHNLVARDINWHQITQDKEKFVTAYKQKLLSMI